MLAARQIDRSGTRLSVALLLSHEIGLRASDISRICSHDVYDPEGKVRETLSVSSGRGERALPLNSIPLRSALADHYELSINNHFPDGPQPLIASQRGGPMTAASLARWMTSAYRAAGLKSGSSRSGRRTLRANLERFALTRH
ncbi:MAG: site-specific integrase [Candidatus Afipia apatlaquensis]|uniref:Site-specific integrase n=1 Tax=Candidatus Afipia apatlaquensis TaxID=2712852 RepID=A0A7C9VMZ5_9BRAD|nr:site-specific integrase [Candidatus Afipia apatlaquensis]